nr:hypothetical protein [Tanacetum cinerariifolium]
MALAIICLATGRKFNFSKYIFDNMVRNVDIPSKFLMYLRFLQFLINNQVVDLSSHTTRYTFPALTQKVFANMRRIGKGFLGVETPLFATMLVQPQAAAEEEDKEDEVPVAPTPPSPTHEPLPPPHEPITIPLQAQPTPPSSLPQEQPTTTSASDMTLLNTLMETCTTLSHKVAALEQDKVAQALEIFKLKRRVKRLEKKRRSKHSGLKRKDYDNAAAKEVNAAEPTVFDDKEVTMTMGQTLIKIKAKKARIFDEQMAKRLHDEEVEQAAAREKQEKYDFKKAKMQEKHLDNIRKYQSLKRKPILVAQARKNMIVYLKNMAGYKMAHFRVSEFKVEALQVKYPLIDWEIHFEGSRSYWKIIRVGSITEAYQSFEDMLKGFDRDDLDALWRLVKEKFSTAVPIVDKEKALWVELKRLFEPNAANVFWKLHRYMHDPLTWKLYTNYGVHQVSSTRRYDIFMFTEKDYPLTDAIMILMISTKIQVDEDCEMARDFVMKIFMEANKPKIKRSLDTSSK